MNNNLFLIDLNHIIYRYYYTMGFKENIDYILTDKKIKILNICLIKFLISLRLILLF